MLDPSTGDAAARQRALDPTASFVVQAPAGSGKTSLLTQRFLRLLATVERPEEVVAITFTRKAAAEMRHRIVSALAAAVAAPDARATPAELLTHALAAAALDNARQRGWELERHPARLHIQTIDGLNHWLVRRMPIGARIGLSPALVDDARPCYALAAQRLLARLEEAGPIGAALERLARLLDHDAAQLEATLADMLGRRDLWLPKLLELGTGAAARPALEALLGAALERELAGLRTRLAGGPVEAAVSVLRAAACALPDGPLAPLQALSGLPAPSAAELPAWQCLANALLTRDGQPRARLDKRDGFPPPQRVLKERALESLALLREDVAATAALAAVRELPPGGYDDAQWALVEALQEILVPAAAELQAVFAEIGQVDHAAVAAAARSALGAEEAPSDLALGLEYRIRHLLVDEYQDTSPAQEALLRRMVAGWQPGDGHTLFCVGDPMQSIYGFREADVTLFLEAQVRGIGDVALTPLVLGRNFRSCRSLVEWSNEAFARVLPAREDYERGAVKHAASTATRDDEPGAGVALHPGLGLDPQRDAQQVAAITAAALAEIAALEDTGPVAVPRTVAILVRSRGALPPILEALRQRGIEYRGVELESLGDRAAVRDLLALARALLHPGDRPAWLAVLRAPWCGLTLADLHALAAADREATLGSLLHERLAALSDDGRRRIERVRPVLEQAQRDFGRQALGSSVHATWLALGGPAGVEDASDLENAAACCEALDRLGAETAGRPEASAVAAAIAGLMASPIGSPDARVQLMTIHKAKGLEFDTVILPALERTVPAADRQLLYWAPVAVAPGRRGIVLASRSDGSDARELDPLERWMRRLERDRMRLELGRLAYVAVTRARRQLHLVGAAQVKLDEEGAPVLAAPRPDSLLGVLWPMLGEAFAAALAADTTIASSLGRITADTRPRLRAPPLQRLPATFDLPPTSDAKHADALFASRFTGGAIQPEFDWAGEEARAVGAVVHRELERLALAGLPPSSLAGTRATWRDELLHEGLPADRLESAQGRLAEALRRVSRSPLAARLLDPRSREGESELALTADLDGELVRVRIDRSFVDEEGIRWIVDWKTGLHAGGGLEQFLAQELQRYSPQLERYSRVMALYDGRPQRLGLYFPLLDRFVEWLPSSPTGCPR
jgi:ATP-dependent helicase/nuclease subunit A